MKLVDIRLTYPEFKNVSDEDLVRAIHKVHFPQEDFENFAKAIGYKRPLIGEAPLEVQAVGKTLDKMTPVGPKMGPPGIQPSMPVEPMALPTMGSLGDFQDDAHRMAAPMDPAERSLEPSTLEKLINAGSSFDRAFVTTVARIPQSIALAAVKIDELLPQALQSYRYSDEEVAKATDPALRAEMKLRGDASELATYRLGEAMIEFAEKTWPANPALQHSFLTEHLPQAFGSMAGFMLSAIVTKGAGAPSWLGALLAGASVESSAAYEEAKRYGASEEDAMWTALAHVPLGMTEAVPIGQAFKRLDRASGGLIKTALIQAGKGAIEEGVQEGLQQFGSNLVFQKQYDKDRKLLEGVGTGMGAGSVVGSVMNLIMAGMGARMRGPRRGPEVTPREEITPKEEPKTKLERLAEEAVAALEKREVEKKPAEAHEVAPGEEIILPTPFVKGVGKREKEGVSRPLRKILEEKGEVSVKAPEPAGAASVEAISRQKQGRFVFMDTRTGKMEIDKSVDAVDRSATPYQIKAWVDNKGTTSVLEYGSKIPPIRKKSLQRELISKVGTEIAKAEKREARAESAVEHFAKIREVETTREKKAAEWVKTHGEVAFQGTYIVPKGRMLAKEGAKETIRVTKSAKEPGKWQATFFEGGATAIPTWDRQYENYKQMVVELQREFGLDMGTAKARTEGIPTKVTVRKAKPKEFIEATKKSTRVEFLTPLSEEDLSKAKLYLNEEGTAGYGIMPDGEQVNLFNASGTRGVGTILHHDSIKHGAKWVSAYDVYWVKKLKEMGATEVKRMKWDPDLAPPNWNYEKYGKPDVVYLVFPGVKEDVEITVPGKEVGERPVAELAPTEITWQETPGLRPFHPEEIQSEPLKKAIRKKMITKGEADVIEGIIDQFPDTWRKHFEVRVSKQALAPTKEQLKRAGVRAGMFQVRGALLEERVGELKTDVKHIITLFQGGDVLTFVHEFGEFIHKAALSKADARVVKEQWLKSGSKQDRGEWFSEQFAKWWLEDYKAPSGLRKIFMKILRAIKNLRTRLPAQRLNPRMSNLFDNIITSGRDIREKFYYSDDEIVHIYVLGTAPTQVEIDNEGFSDNEKTFISWDPGTQCPRQRAFVDWILKQQKEAEFKTADLANVDVLARLYDEALEDGVDVPCDYCYVQQDRQKALWIHQNGGTEGAVAMARAKKVLPSIPYKGQIKKWTQNKIDKVNQRGGLRLFSFSDYVRAFHHAQVDSLLKDAKARGLSVKAITKNPEFVEDFGDRGITINVSIDTNPDGKFGMPWDEAARLKKKYGVKVRAVFMDPDVDYVKAANLKFAGLDPFIDVLTPYVHDDPSVPLPEGAVSMKHGSKGGNRVAEIAKDKKLESRTCCLVGGKCFSLKHNKQCAANCGLTAGKLSVPAHIVRRDSADARTLVEWIRAMGGVWDPTTVGEVREFLPRESGVMGLVRKTGRPWDDLVDDAIADGWIAPGSTGDDLRAALREDIRAMKNQTMRPRPSYNWDEDIAKELEREIENEAERKQAMLELGAQEAHEMTLSLLGTGELPRVTINMVKDILHHTGLKDRDPYGITVNPKDLRNIYTYLQMPEDIRRTFPEFDPVYQIQRAREFEKVVLDNAFAEATAPYFDLNKKSLERVDAVLLEGERTSTDMFTRTELKEKYGLTDAEIKGYKAIRANLNQARNMLIQKMKDFELDEDTIDEFSRTTKGYVPHKWYGDWINVVKDKHGKTVFMTSTNFIDRYTERDRLRKLHPGLEVITIKRKQIPYEAFQEAPPFAVQKLVEEAQQKAGLTPEMKEAMDEALSDLYKSKGFGMHFIQRKGIPGYTETLARPLAEYFAGFSGYLTKMDAVQAFPKAMQRIRTDSNLFRYTTDYIKYVTGDQMEFRAAKSIAYYYYLWGNLKSASINLTQNFVLGWPVLGKHTKFSFAKMTQAMARTASGTLTKGEKQFIEDLKAGGYLDPKMAQEISGYAGNPLYKPIISGARKLSTMLDVFRHAEQFNRRAMAVAVYDAGIRDVVKAAEIIEEAHFHYAKGNRPRMARGLISPIMTFRSWGINYVLWFKNQIKAGEIGAASKSLLALMLFGGLSALPLWDFFKKLYIEHFGTDPETDARERLGKRWGRNLVHGLPPEIGVEFSRSVGVSDMVPTALDLKEIGGVFADIPSRVKKVIHDLQAGDTLRALEDAAPEVIRNPLAAYRNYTKGATTRGGRPVLDLQTGRQLRYRKGEVYRKVLGYYPIRQAEQYNIKETIETIQKQRNDKKKAWADRYRIAILDGDDAEKRRIVAEIRQWNETMRSRGRPEDQIKGKEMKDLIRGRARAVGKPPRYMMPKLRRLKEQYD